MVVSGGQIIHIVEAADNSSDTVHIPSLASTPNYNLEVNGDPLIPVTEFENIPTGGFKLLNGLKVFTGNRCKIEPYGIMLQPSALLGTVRQYPHTLSVKVKQPATRNGSGNWVPGSETTFDYPCRVEPARGNSSFPATDGTRVYFEWIVYMPLPVGEFVTGATVTVKDGATVLSTNEIKRFNRGQLNARIWL